VAVSRWTQTWLSGPSAAGDGGPQQDYRGQRLGLPERGAGSVAGSGARIGAVVVDWLPCYVLAALFTSNPATSTLAIFALLTAVSVAIAGASPGHALLGLRVAMLDGGRARPTAAVTRTILLCLAIPPLIYNSDGRGLHDRAAGTIVLRTR
jgi:uncharacterized RDD family membrane protein YckC